MPKKEVKEKKKSRKKPQTPRSRVRAILRLLFLRSRERAFRLKLDNYSCVRCGKKQSKAKGREQKVCVHHVKKINNWEKVINAVFREILCSPKKLETLCIECHNLEHQVEK